MLNLIRIIKEMWLVAMSDKLNALMAVLTVLSGGLIFLGITALCVVNFPGKSAWIEGEFRLACVFVIFFGIVSLYAINWADNRSLEKAKKKIREMQSL